MIRFDALFIALLVVLVASSALGVVSSQHQARKLHNALEAEHDRTQSLEVEWGRLQLEQSTQAAHGRVEKFARAQLRMAPPQAGQIVVLERP